MKVPRRAARWVIAVAVCLVALHLGLNSEAVARALRPRVEQALRERLGAIALGEHFSLDGLGRVSFGPLRIAVLTGEGKAAQLAPVLEVDAVQVRPRYLALLAGRAEPASVTLRGVRVQLGARGERLRDWLASLPVRPSPAGEGARSADSAVVTLHVEGLQLLAETGKYATPVALLTVPEANATVQRVDGARVVRAEAELPGGGRAEATATLAKDGSGKGEASFEGVTAAVLPDWIAQRIPVTVPAGALSGHGEAEAGPRGKEGSFSGQVEARGVVLRGERLSADEEVGPIDARAEGKLRWSGGGQRVTLEPSRVSLGGSGRAPVTVLLDGQLGRGAEPHLRLEARLERLEYRALISALPPQLAPPETSPRVDGPLGLEARLEGPLSRPQDWELAVKLDLAGMRRAARTSPVPIAVAFPYRPGGLERELWIGEANPHFVPLGELPPYVVRAVTLSEDAGFFGHSGFDFAEMRDSLVSVAQGKRFRGASTLTQQLAKNLYLSRERTYARKVKEALVAIALEAGVSKPRLIEVYLNLIEWGPNVYGLGEAAQHYFGVNPRALTVQQAAFLATIIPNPIKYHLYHERGALSEVWTRRVHDLLVKLRDTGTIDEDQYEEAERSPLNFTPAEGALSGVEQR